MRTCQCDSRNGKHLEIFFIIVYLSEGFWVPPPKFCDFNGVHIEIIPFPPTCEFIRQFNNLQKNSLIQCSLKQPQL